MSWRRELSRLRSLFRRPKLADDLEAEIRAHLGIRHACRRSSLCRIAAIWQRGAGRRKEPRDVDLEFG